MVTSHIPIILLTARVTSSQVREGYESLADDYIMKPFDPELLVVRVANLLINRKNSQNDMERKWYQSTESHRKLKILLFIVPWKKSL